MIQWRRGRGEARDNPREAQKRRGEPRRAVCSEAVRQCSGAGASNPRQVRQAERQAGGREQ